MIKIENKSSIVNNASFLYMRMFVSMIATLYTSRIVLNTLGVIDFGIYNVVAGFVLFFGFINSALASSTTRFLSIDLSKNNSSNIRDTFSNAMILHIALGIIVGIFLSIIGIWYIENKLNIPYYKVETAVYLFLSAGLSLIVTIWVVPYNALFIAKEQFRFIANIGIIETLLKVLFAFILTYVSHNKLMFYGMFTALTSIIINGLIVIISKKTFKESEFHFRFNRSKIKEMISFSNWNLLGVLAGLSYFHGINLVLNSFFGPAINASRSLANQVQGSTNNFVSNFQTVVNPLIFKLYGQKKYKDVEKLVSDSSKYSFFLLLLIIVPLYSNLSLVMHLWLNIVPAYTLDFLKLILIDLLINSTVGPFHTLVQASGQIKIYQILVSGVLLLNIPISYTLLSYGYSPQVTMQISISLSILAQVLRLYYLYHKLQFSILIYIKYNLSRMLIVFMLAIIVVIIASYFQVSTVFDLSISAILLVGTISIVIYVFGLNYSERVYLEKIVISKFNK
jgi:O-antigen/teichoic acid export membrane protein